MTELPTFAVVGHPNKGKSSIVATLSHHDELEISKLSGTTVVSQCYAYRIDNTQLYRLFDTPGFQRPRRAFAWMESCATDASKRLEAVEAFLNKFKGTQEFKDEVELLSPIVKNQAGIIYVVDGSVPYSPEYETEMTILQWTGRPRMALINPIGGEQYIEQWQQALGQYFNLVRVFDPITADMEKQLSILSAFAEVYEPWRLALQQAEGEIRQRQKQIQQQAAHLIADTLSNLLGHKDTLPLVADAVRAITEKKVKRRYQKALELCETQFREKIIGIYSHWNLRGESTALNIDYPDLFDQGNWYLFGLSRQKLVALSASVGAAAGAVLDAGVGGASLMTGALLGGLASGAASVYLTREPDSVSIKGIPLGGKQLTAGPVKNLQFAFVLLGRMVDYQRAVSSRTHANRGNLEVEERDYGKWLDALDNAKQIKLTRLLKKGGGGFTPKELQELQSLIIQLL